MANTPGAIKRIRTTERQTSINRPHIATMRTAINKFEAAVENKADNVEELFQEATKTIDRAVRKGVIHKNNASRNKARIAKMKNAL